MIVSSMVQDRKMKTSLREEGGIRKREKTSSFTFQRPHTSAVSCSCVAELIYIRLSLHLGPRSCQLTPEEYNAHTEGETTHKKI